MLLTITLRIPLFAGTLNKAGDTPLSLARANGHLEVTKYLISIINGDYYYSLF